jgi:type II secretory pathway predicted ATPase ExeA
MYEALLQSADRPFKATPDTKFYFAYDSIENARQSVVRAILRAEGPCLVLGGAGLGKTLLSQLVAEEVETRFDIVKLHAAGLCSRRALLQSILFELEMPYRGLSEGELRMSIMERLSPSPETAPDGVLILVDEAHTLAAKLLEELRLITNFARNGQPRARLVLIGSMRLEDTFAQPQMDSFNQRIAARCYLQPMTREQTAEFVRHQLRCAQVNPSSMITNDGLRTLYSASEGVPRLVNQVMDHALVLGITNGQCPISASLIEEAWSDLQQLPAPWHSTEENSRSSSASSGSVTTSTIEFGTLQDDDSFGGSLDEESPFPMDDDSDMLNHINEDDPEVRASGFFAAFSEADANSLRSYIEGIEVDALPELTKKEVEVAPVEVATPEPEKIEKPVINEQRVVFDASRAFGHKRHSVAYPRELATNSTESQNAHTHATSKPGASNNFFAGFSPDQDQQNTAEDADEQGIWANDPPIEGNRQPAPSHEIFGEDFEEEIPLDITGGVGRVRQIFEPADIRVINQAAKAEDVIAKQQLSGSTQYGQKQVATESIVANWTVDVAATAPECEIELHREIEDLVSQLNFSAFAIEPFSVEQIAIDYDRGAVTKVQGQENTERQAIYTLHTTKSVEMDDIHANTIHDDDRDLLIIEEELPITNRTSNDPIGAPVGKAAPYSQLFAKLRH